MGDRFKYAWHGSGRKWDALWVQVFGCAVGGLAFWHWGVRVPQSILDNPLLGAVVSIVGGGVSGAFVIFCLRWFWWPLHLRLEPHGGVSGLFRRKLGSQMWPLLLMGLAPIAFISLFSAGAIWWVIARPDLSVGETREVVAADSLIKMTIGAVTFPPAQETEFVMDLRLANTGAPSTVKNFVLSAYKDGKLYEQFPPREGATTPRWGAGSPATVIVPQLILRNDPLQSGQEVDIRINYQTVNNSKNEVGQPGMVLRMAAVDVNGKGLAAEYTVKN